MQIILQQQSVEGGEDMTLHYKKKIQQRLAEQDSKFAHIIAFVSCYKTPPSKVILLPSFKLNK